MVVIFPSDPSTKFLKSIIETTKPFIDGSVDTCRPDDYHLTLKYIEISSVSKTIVFLGHGYSEGLYGGCYVANGKQVLLNTKQGKESFKEKKIILLACRSADYLTTLDLNFSVALGFGNIITSREDLQTKSEKAKYNLKAIDIFRTDLLQVFSNSLVEAYTNNYTFVQLYNALKLRINKKLALYTLSAIADERLAGELFFDLKKEMKLLGNGNLKLTE